ncbi:MAG: hypothetical protein KAS72_05690 [Phycisphaerales bacterium]|nr:hypothetical protein [Phycisphaerales bacterium]
MKTTNRRSAMRALMLAMTLIPIATAGALRMVGGSAADLKAALEAHAAELSESTGYGVTLIFNDERLVDWWVSVSDPRIIMPADELAPEADFDAAFQRWADHLHAKLFATTVALEDEIGCDPHFNAQTDVSGIYFADFRKNEWWRENVDASGKTGFMGVAYRGSRHSFIGGDEDSDTDLRPEDMDALAGIELTATILPRRLVWDHREPIEGMVHYRNTGERRIPLARSSMDVVRILSNDGRKPEFFFMQGSVSYPRWDWHNKFLMPGETLEVPFIVHTDPQEPLQCGHILPPGGWVLSPRDFLNMNIPTVATRVPITVAARPGDYVGPRIVHMLAAGSRLLLIRESSIVELVHPWTGERLDAPAQMAVKQGPWPPSWWNIVMSPDGALLATGFRDPPSRDEDAVDQRVRTRRDGVVLHDVANPEAEPRRLMAPEDVWVPVFVLEVMRFTPDGKKIFAKTHHVILVFDVASGEVERVIRNEEEMWPLISPDGSHVVHPNPRFVHGLRFPEQLTLHVRPVAEDGPAVSFSIQTGGEEPSVHLAADGLYVIFGDGGGVVYYPYDGTPRVELMSCPIEFGDMSADGSLICFVSPPGEMMNEPEGACVVQVWSTKTQRKLSEIRSAERLRPMFLSNPTRLACAVVRQRGGAKWLDEQVLLYDPLTGEKVGEANLTPPHGSAAWEAGPND